MAKRKGSRRWKLDMNDVIEAWKYIWAILLVSLAGNLTGVQDVLAAYMSPENAVIAMSLLGPFIKRLAEDYESKK